MPRTLVCTPSESGRNCCHGLLSGYGPSGISCCNGGDRNTDLLPFDNRPAEDRPPERRFVPSAIGGVPACSLAALLGGSPSPFRCHPRFAVPSTVACPHDAWHRNRPYSTTGPLSTVRRNGGSCLRRLVECRPARWQPCSAARLHLPVATHDLRCHPPWHVHMVPGTEFGQRAEHASLRVGRIARHRVQAGRLPVPPTVVRPAGLGKKFGQ